MRTKDQLEAILEVLRSINEDFNSCWCENHQDIVIDNIEEIEEELKQLKGDKL